MADVKAKRVEAAPRQQHKGASHPAVGHRRGHHTQKMVKSLTELKKIDVFSALPQHPPKTHAAPSRSLRTLLKYRAFRARTGGWCKLV